MIKNKPQNANVIKFDNMITDKETNNEETIVTIKVKGQKNCNTDIKLVNDCAKAKVNILRINGSYKTLKLYNIEIINNVINLT